MIKIAFISFFVLAVNFVNMPAPDVYEFLKDDKTNEIQYSAEFQCKEYSEVLSGNAKSKGLDSGTVWVALENGGVVTYHVFVYFLIDGDTLWVEPQNDNEYEVSGTGEKLCYKNGDCVADKILFMTSGEK